MRTSARFYCCVTLGTVFGLLCPKADSSAQLPSNVVININDSGPGSLRDAITFANTCGSNVVFAIPPFDGTVKTITPSSPLPAITNSFVIDGYTQPGASPNTLTDGDNAVLLIQLSPFCGEGCYSGLGLTIAGTGSTVRGLVVSGFYGAGILVEDTGSNNIIEGNFIGTDVTGTNALGNGFYELAGLEVDGRSNTVGGANAAARNVISGNTADGIDVYGDNNAVLGNFIGTDVTGTNALGNGYTGVYLDGSSNTVGGASAGAGNVVSGNYGDGVDVYGNSNAVLGNFIGTDATGSNVIGSGGDGELRLAPARPNQTEDGGGGAVGVLVRADNNTISNNVISGNGNGIFLDGAGGSADFNVVQGNRIGTDVTGNRILSNYISGIFIDGWSGDGSEALSNTVGGVAVGEGNIIAGSGSNGVMIVGRGATGNAILGNSIFSNTGLGIDLGGDGVTANDACDPDVGPNQLQNFPVLLLAAASSSSLTVSGSLNSVGSTLYRLEFFANSACNPSGFGEGETFIGWTSVTTRPSSNCSITFGVTFPVSGLTTNDLITATATDPFLNTSEFSQCLRVTSANHPPVAICRNVTVAADANCQAHVTANQVDNGSFDPDGDPITFSLSPPGPYPVGVRSVTLIVVDSSGASNTCSATITVLDQTPPTITCPPTKTVNADSGRCSASNVNLGAPVVSDNCGVARVTSNAPASFPVGTNTVTWTVTDTHGNTNSCQQLVIVLDNQPPTITCPPTKTVNADSGQCSASNVNLGAPVVSDNCGVAGVTSNAPASFPVGTNTVTWTVSDVHGHTNSCRQLVIVIDNQPPTISCPAPVTVPCASAVPAPDPSSVTAADNCGTVRVSFVNDVITNQACANRFTVIRTYRATDSAGNSTTCQQIITVNDTSAPVITSSPSNLTVECSSQVPAADDAAVSATDNCGGPVTITHDADVISNQSCSNQYTISRTYHATDTCGNSTSVTQTITVNDTTPPTISCPVDVTTNTDVGQYFASGVALGSPAVADNCGGAVTVTNDAPGTFPNGTNLVVWTATDACGNFSSCTQNVIVIDNEPPTITCPVSITVTGALGTVSNAVTYAGLTATDNCTGDVSLVSTPRSGSFFRYGTTNVTCTATDSSGNSNSCTFSVTVDRPLGPDLTGFWLATTAFSLNRNNYIFGAFQVVNQGTAPASNSVLRLYRSTSSSTNSTAAHVIKTFRIPRLDAGQTNPPSICGVKLPRGVSSTNQLLIAVADANNKVLETDEENNLIVTSPPTNFVPQSAAVARFYKTVRQAKDKH
jgi:parallel beta-helix repeat protein